MESKYQEAHENGVGSGGGSSRSVLDSQDGGLSRLENLIQIQTQPSDKSIHSILAELGTPYASVGILSNGRITAKVLGSSEAGHPVLNNDTLFQAASISKPLTAMAVIKLCQEGKLDIDSTLR